MTTDNAKTFDVSDEYKRAERVRSVGEALAELTIDDLPTPPGGWETKDREVAEQRARQAARDERSRMVTRSGELKDNGFPLMFIEAALGDVVWDTEAMHHARMFVQTPAKILVLAGGVGVGKTTASAWVALKGQDPRPGFIRTSELERRGRYDKALGQWLAEKSSLFIDDIGTEVLDGKGVFRSLLEEVIDMFYGDRKTLVLTTNLRPRIAPVDLAKPGPLRDDDPQFKERYGDRVWSRVMQTGVWGDCGTTDLRKDVRP